MRHSTTLLLAILMLSLSGCSTERQTTQSAQTRPASAPDATAGLTASDNNSAGASGQRQNVSLTQAAQAQAAPVDAERKIIRNAELTLELAAPAEGLRKLTAIAEARGGFVVSSESTQRSERDGGSAAAEMVVAVLRVPATQFDAAINEVRAIGNRVRQEKIAGQDVTEQFIDLEARLRTQRALEAQFLDIMKGATKVEDALEVNRQLAQVRGEIEQVEGRLRYLQNQTTLSTIKVTLETPTPFVSADTNGFFAGLKRAFGDGIDVAAAIILGLIRVGVALLPILLLIVLPCVLLWRWLRRRGARRVKMPLPPRAES